MNNFAWFMIASIAIFGIIAWSEVHDKQIEVGAQIYEMCVQQKYGVSPANYYQEHGEYPTCRVTAQ